ncbi:hypothetical protein P1X14_12745 [Sphingomonas sp. AOB5]|uniref:hypothetical protein n=1 Tax=Sphingomonas sp. AOB5 TaxID=3034017 RepID=UPI0023F7F5F9|nr:hypothetical protein [Sphingomonas sp. AOB5]MDF7776120.1 hypothetical protein [Sphingomonas sp. AOB5]
MAVLAMPALSGCDHGDSQGNAVIVVPADNAVVQAAPSAPAANLSTDHIERLPDSASAPEPASAAPPAQMQTRKDFTDPPLPAELNQDGGLKPLPPRPARRTDPGGSENGEEKPQ